jgi:hypothetical protein
MLSGSVPWPEPVPAPGTSNVVMAPLGAHEAVTYRVCVHGHAHDGPHWVDASGERALAGAFTRARSIERGDGAVGSAHVPVKYVARINILSSNRTCRIDAID